MSNQRSTTQGGPNIITNGLVLYLDAANDISYPKSGTVWNDLSGNKNDGTFNNTPTFNTSNLGSIGLDGLDDFLHMGVDSKGSNTGNYTFGGWLKTTPGETNWFYVRGVDYGQAGQGWSLNVAWNTTTKKLSAAATDTTPTTFTATQSGTTNDNTWVYGVGVWESGVGISLYINGLFELTTATASTQLRNNNTYGWTSGAGNVNTNFLLSNIATYHVYDRVLSAQEILQNYNALKSRYGLT